MWVVGGYGVSVVGHRVVVVSSRRQRRRSIITGNSRDAAFLVQKNSFMIRCVSVVI